MKPQTMLSFSLLIHAVLIWGIYCSSFVFPQGLQESVEGWEEEENLVSDVHHLLCLFLLSLFLEDFSLSLSYSLPRFFLFLGDCMDPRPGKGSDPRVRPVGERLQLAHHIFLFAPANLGHVVAVTLPRCQSFSVSGSSCSSTALMRFSHCQLDYPPL